MTSRLESLTGPTPTTNTVKTPNVGTFGILTDGVTSINGKLAAAVRFNQFWHDVGSNILDISEVHLLKPPKIATGDV